MGEETWTQVHYRKGRMVHPTQGRFPSDVAYPQDSADRFGYRTRERNTTRRHTYQKRRDAYDVAYRTDSANRFRPSRQNSQDNYQNRQNDNDVAYRHDSADRFHLRQNSRFRVQRNQYGPTFAEVVSRPRQRPTFAEVVSRPRQRATFAEGVSRPRQRATYAEATSRFRRGQFEKRDRIPPPRPQAGNEEPSGRPNTQAPRMAASPEVRAMAKNMLKLIRLTHHLRNVTSGNDLPVTFGRLENHLSEVIKPAYPSEKLIQLLYGNAKNWVHTTQILLRDHYVDVIKQVMTELIPSLTDDWHLAFDIAKRWARQGLGRRLTSETMEYVEAVVAAEYPATLNETEAATATTTYTTSTRQHPTDTPIGTTTATVTNNLVDIEVQTSPLSRDRIVSLDDDFPPLPPVHGISPILQPVAREQRPRRTRNPCVQAEVPMEILPSSFSQDTQPHRELEQHLIQLQDVQPESGGSPTIVQVHLPVDTSLQHSDRTSPNATPPRNMDTGTSNMSPMLPRILTARSSIQSMLGLTSTVNPLSTLNTTYRPIRHINTTRKMVDWSFSVRKKWVILGDSNLSRIPAYDIPDLQMDSFPGGTFLHAEKLIRKATISVTVEKLVLAFGINHREQKVKETAVKQLQRAIKAAKDHFPHAEIWVPIINFSRSIPLQQQEALETLNRYIQEHVGYIPALANTEFDAERSRGHIHWTTHTAKAMLKHWTSFLNFNAP